jgi:hypothetical protein
VHVALVAGLLVALAMQVAKQLTQVRGLPLAAATLVAGLGGTALYLRVRVLGKVLRVASVGPLLSAGLFLFASSATALVLPQSTPAPQAGPATGAAKRPPIVVFALDELPCPRCSTPRATSTPRTSPTWPGWPSGPPGTATPPAPPSRPGTPSRPC